MKNKELFSLQKKKISSEPKMTCEGILQTKHLKHSKFLNIQVNNKKKIKDHKKDGIKEKGSRD